ncbi:UNVERIFIED_CONTAM: hypothetical protein K2H54_054915 [Gekko kuhli]
MRSPSIQLFLPLQILADDGLTTGQQTPERSECYVRRKQYQYPDYQSCSPGEFDDTGNWSSDQSVPGASPYRPSYHATHCEHVVDHSHRDEGDKGLTVQDMEPRQAMPGQDSSKGFLDLLQNMVTALGIQSTSAAAPVTDLVHDMLQLDRPVPLVLPALLVHITMLQEPWKKPASVLPVLKCYDMMYRVQGEINTFLQSQPKPNSAVVHSSSKMKQSQYLAPPDREGRK